MHKRSIIVAALIFIAVALFLVSSIITTKEVPHDIMANQKLYDSVPPSQKRISYDDISKRPKGALSIKSAQEIKEKRGI